MNFNSRCHLASWNRKSRNFNFLKLRLCNGFCFSIQFCITSKRKKDSLVIINKKVFLILCVIFRQVGLFACLCKFGMWEVFPMHRFKSRHYAETGFWHPWFFHSIFRSWKCKKPRKCVVSWCDIFFVQAICKAWTEKMSVINADFTLFFRIYERKKLLLNFFRPITQSYLQPSIKHLLLLF